MPDIIYKAKINEPYLNGTIISYADKLGNKGRILPTINEIPLSGVVEAKYTSRWDDITYYSN